jgi:hypothetical protein
LCSHSVVSQHLWNPKVHYRVQGGNHHNEESTCELTKEVNCTCLLQEVHDIDEAKVHGLVSLPEHKIGLNGIWNLDTLVCHWRELDFGNEEWCLLGCYAVWIL